MRILVAPDKFKGTATAQAVCESIAIALNSDHDIAIQPLADGGEGTIEAFRKYVELEPDGQFAAGAQGMLAGLTATVETEYEDKTKKKKKRRRRKAS